MSVAKSKVFEGSTLTVEFENVCAVISNHSHCLDILLFGNHSVSLNDGEEIARFKTWYGIYLEEKHGGESEENGVDIL